MKKVLSCICDEPEGKIERSVYLLDLTIENLMQFYEKASKHKTLFYDDIRGNFKKFCEAFLVQDDPNNEFDVLPKGLLWVIDDFVGVYYMTDISPARDALVHYSFFDARHRGRQLLTLNMLKYVFDTYKFHRLSTFIATYAGKYVFPFVNSLGFVSEGKKRSCVLYDGKWYDALLFGLLREELEWVLTSKLSAAALPQD